MARRVGGHARRWNQNEALHLYKQGKTDQEIAEAVNSTRNTIRNWREELGLKANRRKRDE